MCLSTDQTVISSVRRVWRYQRC